MSMEEEKLDRIEESELVHRLDKRLLLFAMFGNLIKTLDNTNLCKIEITRNDQLR